MQYRKDKYYVLFVILSLVITISLVSTCFIPLDGSKDTRRPSEISNTDYKSIPIASGYWENDSITINATATGLNAQNWTWASNQEWCSGSGSWNDPYLIENITFSSDGQSCITILNSQDYYFIINNITCLGANSTNNGGIVLENTNNGTISNSYSISNYYGIYIHEGSNNTIKNNIILNSEYHGIYFSNNSDLNYVFENTLENNTQAGLQIDASTSDIYIYSNYFINNTPHAVDNAANTNYWNYSSTGNYWDDYDSIPGGIDWDDNGYGDVPYDKLPNLVDYLPIWDDGVNIAPIFVEPYPSNFSYISNTSGNMITWNISDLNTNIPVYMILIDNIINETDQPWISEVAFSISVDGLPKGDHNITIIATDGPNGFNITDEIWVSVLNNYPEIIGDIQGNSNWTVSEDFGQITIDLSLNKYDLDNSLDDLSWSYTGWNSSLAIININSDLITINSNANISGSDTFTLYLNDSEGGFTSVSITFSIGEVNDNPTIIQTNPIQSNVNWTVNEDYGEVKIDLSTNKTDIDNLLNELTWSQTGWNNSLANIDITNDIITISSISNSSGSVTFTLFLNDNEGGSTSITITFTVIEVNDNPTILQTNLIQSNVNWTVNEDFGEVKIDLSTNKTDIDNLLNELTWSQTGWNNSLANIDITNDLITISSIANISGSVTFSLLLNDNEGGSTFVLITFIITEVNDDPNILQTSLIQNNENWTVSEDFGIVTIDLSTNKTDIDNLLNELTWSQTGWNDSLAVLSINYDLITINSYANISGSVTFTLFLNDNEGGSRSLTIIFTIIEVNDNPTILQLNPIQNNPNWTVNEDFGIVVIDLSSNKTDVDNSLNELTWSFSGWNSSLASININNDLISISSIANISGSVTFSLILNDNEGGTRSILISFTIIEVNDNPTILQSTSIQSNSNWTVGEDFGQVTIDLSSNKTDIDDALIELYWSQTGWNSSLATLDITYDLITITSFANISGGNTFTLLLNDDEGGTASILITFIVTEINDNPTILQSIPIQNNMNWTVDEDFGQITINLSPNKIDIDNSLDQLTWSQSGWNNSLAVIDITDDIISISSISNIAGSVTITLYLHDNEGGISSISIEFIINPINDIPIIFDSIQLNPNWTQFEDFGTFQIDLSGNESDVESSGIELDWYIIGLNTSLVHLTGEYSDNDVLTFSSIPNISGIDAFTLYLTDGTDESFVSIAISITPVNDLPIITGQINTNPVWTQNEDFGSFQIDLSSNESDIESYGVSLDWYVTGLNTSLVQIVGEYSHDDILTFNSISNAYGTNSFTLWLTDGTDTDSILISLTVNPVNDAPVILGDIASNPVWIQDEDFGNFQIDLTDYEFDVENIGSNLDWFITGLNISLISAFGEYSSNDILTFSSVSNAYGNDTFTLWLTDGEIMDSVNISITIIPVNDIPVILGNIQSNPIWNQLEDFGSFEIDLSSNESDVESVNTDLDWYLTGINPAFIEVTGDYSDDDILIFSSVQDVYGSDIITLWLTDGVFTDFVIISIIITSINDFPVILGDIASDPLWNQMEDFGSFNIDLSDYESDVESSSLSLNWFVTGLNQTLVSVTGEFTNEDVLTFTSFENKFGNDSFLLWLTDGTDEIFININLTINPINDIPIILGDIQGNLNWTQNSNFGSFQIDLTDHEFDIESIGSSLDWYVTGLNPSLIIITGEYSDDDILTFSSVPDSFGTDIFTLWLTDGDNSVSVEIFVNINDELVFQVKPENSSYEYFSMGNDLTWIVLDASVSNPLYSITRNGTEIVTNQIWSSGNPINLDIDGLSIGFWLFQITLTDGVGEQISDEVLISVYDLPIIIFSPDDYNYEFNSTGHQISWIIHDENVFNPTYSIFRSGIPVVVNELWISDLSISYDLDGLAVGYNNFLIIIDDGMGGIITDDIWVMVFDNPEFTTIPSDFSYLYGTTGNIINWSIFDDSTFNPVYSIFRNGTPVIVDQEWVSTPETNIIFDIDGLTPGFWFYRITAEDGVGGVASDEIWVLVYDIPTIMVPPDDTYYRYGDGGNSVTWNITSELVKNSEYTIFLNGTPITGHISEPWVSGETIVLIIDFLDVGFYNYTIEISNGVGGFTTDQVWVIVFDVPSLSLQQDDYNYENGTLGNGLIWVVTDENVHNAYYSLFRNGNPIVVNQSWTSEVPIEINIDGLNLGIWEYSLEIYDGMGGNMSDEVIIVVYDAPLFTVIPDDVLYDLGEGGNEISWELFCAMINNAEYNIYRNGILIESNQVWISGDMVLINVDNLPVGDHTIRIEASNGYGGISYDEVVIQVHDIPVFLSTPEDLSFEYNSVGNDLNWLVFDEFVLNPTYILLRNGIEIAVGQTWSSEVLITENLDTLPVGFWNFTLVLDNGNGGYNSDEVLIVVYDNPIIVEPQTLNFEIGYTGNYLQWNISDSYVLDPIYTIFVNGTSTIIDENWSSNNPILFNVDYLSVGFWNVTIKIYDGMGGFVSDQVWVIIFDVPIFYDQPADTINYAIGTLGNSLNWTVFDANTHNPTYSIFKNDIALIENQSWISGVSFSLDIDGLGVGIFNYTIIVKDGMGGSIYDEVFVIPLYDEGEINIDALATYNTPNYGNWTWACSNGWCSGSGTWEDPYIIKDLICNGNFDSSCLIIEHSREYFTIQDCSFYNSGTETIYAGIRLYNTTNGIIRDNVCNQNSLGVYLEASGNITLYNNNFTDSDMGIYLKDSYENIIEENLISESDDGIRILGGFDNQISNNIFVDCYINGIYIVNSNSNSVWENNIDKSLYGIKIYNSMENDIFNNIISENYWYGISLDGSDANNIFNNNVSENEQDGIYLVNSRNNAIYDNIIQNNGQSGPYSGIFIDNSDSNILTDNIVNFNSKHGIYIRISSLNSILYNTLNNNSEAGLFLEKSDYTSANGNILSGNHLFGIFLVDNSDFNNFSSNIIEFNNILTSGAGIFIHDDCDYNIFNDNIIQNNWEYGIYIYDDGLNELCNYNVFYNNSLYSNSISNARDDAQYNSWDNGSIGNIWDDYLGYDWDDNGIGEQFYSILGTAASTDNFPIYEDGPNTIPTFIIRPLDLVYEDGEIGNYLNWTVEDLNLINPTFSVFRNGTLIIDENTWSSNNPITINVDSLWEGFHNYTIIVSDGVGGVIFDSVWVKVNYDPLLLAYPEDSVFENGTSIIPLNWLVSDSVTENPTYTVIRNGTIISDSQVWNANEQITYNIIDLDVGFWNFTIILHDGLGRDSSDQVWIVVYDKPVFTSIPEDVLFNLEIQNKELIWIISDNNVFRPIYEIFSNGILIDSGNWTSGVSITVNLDTLVENYYYISIIVEDGMGGIKEDNVSITINGDPQFDGSIPGFLEFEYNTTGNLISWNVIDGVYLNRTYSILLNGDPVVLDEEWNTDQNIDFSLDFLNEGYYNITLVVFDGMGGFNSTETQIIVHSRPEFVEPFPDNMIILRWSVGNTISWIVNDPVTSNPYYNVYINGTLVYLFRAWTSDESIEIPINSFNPGWFNFTIVVNDGYGYESRDEVWILVNDEPLLLNPHAEEIVFQEDYTSNSITWNIIDYQNLNPTYSVQINNETIILNNNWESNDLFSLDLSNYIEGYYNISIFIEDGFGGNIYESFYVIINAPPKIDRELDYLCLCELNSQNHSIIWNISDPVWETIYYVIYQDEVIIQQNYLFVNMFVEININSTELGLHNYSIIITDGYGGITQDTVLVNIYNRNEFLKSPEPISFREGSQNNSITWVIDDINGLNLNNSFLTYVILLDGREFKQDNAPVASQYDTVYILEPGKNITIIVDGLEEGDYVFSLIIFDGMGGIIQNDVTVTVEPKSILTPGLLIFFSILFAGVVGYVVVRPKFSRPSLIKPKTKKNKSQIYIPKAIKKQKESKIKSEKKAKDKILTLETIVTDKKYSAEKIILHLLKVRGKLSSNEIKKDLLDFKFNNPKIKNGLKVLAKLKFIELFKTRPKIYRLDKNNQSIKEFLLVESEIQDVTVLKAIEKKIMGQKLNIFEAAALFDSSVIQDDELYHNKQSEPISHEKLLEPAQDIILDEGQAIPDDGSELIEDIDNLQILVLKRNEYNVKTKEFIQEIRELNDQIVKNKVQVAEYKSKRSEIKKKSDNYRNHRTKLIGKLRTLKKQHEQAKETKVKIKKSKKKTSRGNSIPPLVKIKQEIKDLENQIITEEIDLREEAKIVKQIELLENLKLKHGEENVLDQKNIKLLEEIGAKRRQLKSLDKDIRSLEEDLKNYYLLMQNIYKDNSMLRSKLNKVGSNLEKNKHIANRYHHKFKTLQEIRKKSASKTKNGINNSYVNGDSFDLNGDISKLQELDISLAKRLFEDEFQEKSENIPTREKTVIKDIRKKTKKKSTKITKKSTRPKKKSTKITKKSTRPKKKSTKITKKSTRPKKKSTKITKKSTRPKKTTVKRSKPAVRQKVTSDKELKLETINQKIDNNIVDSKKSQIGNRAVEIYLDIANKESGVIISDKSNNSVTKRIFSNDSPETGIVDFIIKCGQTTKASVTKWMMKKDYSIEDIEESFSRLITANVIKPVGDGTQDYCAEIEDLKLLGQYINSLKVQKQFSLPTKKKQTKK